MRNGEVSYWWRALGGFPPRRPSLPGPTEADVCIVGGGYTGLWTAYYLAGLRPGLRIVVLEAAFAGYGASGRNGGWVTAELPGSRARYAQAAGGTAGVGALEAELRSTVDEVGRVCEAESIDCDFVKGGRLSVATTPSQLARMREGLAAIRERGDGDDVYQFLSGEETRERVNVSGALGGLYAPASARVQPAALAAGIAAAAERRGVEIYEATPVSSIEPASAGQAGAVARTKFGDVRARSVLRCTEGYTAALPGLRRALLPMNSHMLVTEPLDGAAWQEIGWAACETLSDEAHAYMYAQRTADGRIALGGRGVPYRFASAVDHLGMTDQSTVAALTGVLRRMFPAAADAQDRARVVRRARRAPRLVRVGDVPRRVGHGLGGRLHRARGRRRQPRGAHARRPGGRGAVSADHAALGGAPQPGLGARARALGGRARAVRALPAGRPARVAGTW